MSETTLSIRPEAPASASQELSAEKTKRILLVEGDGFTRIVLLLRLRLAGFKVDFTSNGYLGLGKLRACRPDILLLELKLCGLSGLELIKAARAEPGFGNRPIYVFTHVDRMNRTARKELVLLATKVFDKGAMTREELVQTFAEMFFKQAPTKNLAPIDTMAKLPPEALGEMISSDEIEEIVAGVREQSELLAKESGARESSGQELLSRVSFLKNCAEAARLPNLARHTRGLENFLEQLCKRKKSYTGEVLNTVIRAVQVMSGISLKTAGKEQSLDRFKAVLVDEDPRSSEATDKALREVGFNTVCFENAGRAREHLASKPADLIIANLVLPEAHGLEVADIRRLPLHGGTPILFAPDPTLSMHADEDLPTSAPHLDSEPVLLAELVVKALNEVQSPQTLTTAASLSQTPSQPTLAQPAPGPSASLPSEDGFELFARAPSDSSFIDASIPNEPFLRAEPGTHGPDREAEFLIQLPAASVDGIANDERALEALPPSALFMQAQEAPRPETPAEDQAAAAAWLAAAASDAGQAVQNSNSASTIEQNEAAAVPDAVAATPNYGEIMNHQLEATAAEYTDQVEVLRRQQHPREDLAARVCAAEMALYHAKADAERKGKTIEALQAQLAESAAQRAQLDVETAPEQSPAEQQALARCAELEQEVASLRQAFEGFDGGLAQPQQAAVEADKRIQELAAELEKQKAEAELRQQLEAAKNFGEPAETARQQAEARCVQLEQELAGLRQAHAELAGKLEQKGKPEPAKNPGQPSGDESGQPQSELEQQVRQGVAALARATAELAKERGERQRSQQRAAELNGRLQALHDDLRRTLQAQHEDLARIAALEEENRQITQALEQRTADVEQHQAEHRLTEEELDKTKESNAQLRKDLAFYEEANKKFGGGRQELQARLEASLNAARENEARLQQETTERQRLAENLESAQRELQNQARRREGLEQELKATQEALQDREAKLQKESAERQRLNEALRSVQGNAQDRSERDLELTKLQSSLEEEQVERKRQETQLARIRQKAVDAAHTARALRTNLRRQIREPVDNLVHSTRSLLELELREDQKQLAEAVLQDVLLVQTRLREPDMPQGDSSEPAAPKTP